MVKTRWELYRRQPCHQWVLLWDSSEGSTHRTSAASWLPVSSAKRAQMQYSPAYAFVVSILRPSSGSPVLYSTAGCCHCRAECKSYKSQFNEAVESYCTGSDSWRCCAQVPQSLTPAAELRCGKVWNPTGTNQALMCFTVPHGKLFRNRHVFKL